MYTFGDKCHHGKEENYLFTLLAKKGVHVNGCPLAVLLHEHEKGRSLLADLKVTSETYIRKPGAGREALLGTLRQLIGALSHTHLEGRLLALSHDRQNPQRQ
jgi:hemerythrin-like domain-containing protein